MALFSEALKRARHKRIAPYIRGDVLDMACGPATILELFPEKIATYCGVELTEKRIVWNRNRYPEHEFVQRDLETDALALGRQFDTVLMVALVEHILNQRHLFEEVIKHLRQDGRVVITTPTPFGNDIVHRIGTLLGFFSRGAADDHVVIYNKKRLQIVARKLCLVIEVYKRFQFGCNQLVVLRHAKGDCG